MGITYKKNITFKGKLYKELFYNSGDAFGAALISTEDDIEHKKNGLVTIRGNFLRLEHAIEYTIVGELFQDKKYGWQYKTINVSHDDFENVDVMKNYLCSIISEDRANLLIDVYPNLVKSIVENTDFEPDYSLLPGIAEKSFNSIKEKILNTYLMSEILAFLSPLGISFTMIKRIAESETNIPLLKQKILDNPYILVEIPMLSFIKVDAFALNLDPDFKYSESRMKACVQYILKKNGEDDGHCWVSISEIKLQLRRLTPEVVNLFDNFIEEEREKTKNSSTDALLYVDDKRCGLFKTYIMEKFIDTKLKKIFYTENKFDIKDFDEKINNANEYLGFELSEQQVEIIKSIADNNITVISGKAGTGKSSLIKGILSVYGNHRINMCTLSAKAARRVVEITGHQASTIHRLLQYKATGFDKNAKNQLECDILIVDEVSMVDVYLFYSLLLATPSNCKLILVGDNMQLPAIGLGAIFTDILESKNKFNILKLTKIYRQAEQSGIVMDANKIRDGIMPLNRIEPRVISGENKDMIYLFKNKKEDINETIITLFMQCIKNGMSESDIIVLLPRKADVINSTRATNNKIQSMLRPHGTPFVQFGDKIFKLGDRVLNVINDYDKNVMNGEIGTVISVKPDSIIINFEENIVEYEKENFNKLELGYALTVHKMQGSSAKCVIIGLDNSHRVLLSSNLIYTAITRSELKCVVVSEVSAFKYGVSNTTENFRNTFLSEFLK